jgi:hypothetical protein
VSSTQKGDLLPPDGSLQVDQTILGAVTDAEGDAAWLVNADLRADLTRSGGSVVLAFTLEEDGVETPFVARAPVVDVAGDLVKGDPMVFTFAGDYGLVGAGEETSPIKTSGSFWAKLVVWSDGVTPVLTHVTLIP